ncbi:hypothetical protein M9H77_22367 [Catharanthus roseus]|uniref:Uncharacterized protein n=1 Tax=Catharanthus roseus TaxID=4058 RepID=A0ACC0ASC1_CATRO|nr:hypothetical protein M9H77_22367 [Catharanthus roseus]
MSDQKKENAMEEKRRVERGGFNEEQSVIGSISTSLEECEYKKSVVNTKESKGKTKETVEVDHMLKCSSPCAYLEKQLLDNFARIKPYHDLDLPHDNIFFDLLVANFSSSCASMWSKIHIFFGSFVESGYDERIS